MIFRCVNMCGSYIQSNAQTIIWKDIVSVLKSSFQNNLYMCGLGLVLDCLTYCPLCLFQVYVYFYYLLRHCDCQPTCPPGSLFLIFIPHFLPSASFFSLWGTCQSRTCIFQSVFRCQGTLTVGSLGSVIGSGSQRDSVRCLIPDILDRDLCPAGVFSLFRYEQSPKMFLLSVCCIFPYCNSKLILKSRQSLSVITNDLHVVCGSVSAATLDSTSYSSFTWSSDGPMSWVGMLLLRFWWFKS